MIGLGLASSHATAMFCPAEYWPTVYAGIPEYMKGSQPDTAKLETPEVIQQQIARLEKNFARLRDEIAAYKPDALIYVGDDQNDMFNASNNPTFAVFTGDEVWGATVPRYLGQDPKDSRLHVPVHSDLAKRIHKGLIKRDFDVANCSKMQPLGHPERGVSHMLIFPHPKLVPNNDIPVIPIFINQYFPPLPSAKRCWALGKAIADILKDGPERVAIYASGGLSHDPLGPRAGWIDEAMDNWILERLERGEQAELQNLFTFDSASLRGGSAEIRSWITVAAAMDRPAKRIDYFPSHHAKTGLAWAYWPEERAGQR